MLIYWVVPSLYTLATVSATISGVSMPDTVFFRLPDALKNTTSPSAVPCHEMPYRKVWKPPA